MSFCQDTVRSMDTIAGTTRTIVPLPKLKRWTENQIKVRQ